MPIVQTSAPGVIWCLRRSWSPSSMETGGNCIDLFWILKAKYFQPSSRSSENFKKCTVCHRICYAIIHSWFESLFFLKVLFKNVFPEVFEPGREMHSPCPSQSAERSGRWVKPCVICRRKWNCSLPQLFTSLRSALSEVFIMQDIQTGTMYTLGHPMPSQYFSSLSELSESPQKACENMITLAPLPGFLIQ